MYPGLAQDVKDAHERVGLTASGHDTDHDFEVGQLALMVCWKENRNAAMFAGIAGLLHSTDRIIERELGSAKETISTAPEEMIEQRVRELIQPIALTGAERQSILEAVIHHGSKPNRLDDDLVMIAVADADRLANMGASLPIRAGQHYDKLRVLNPQTIQYDPSRRSPREKYNNPDSVLWDLQNAIDWYRCSSGPYAIRLPRAREIAKVRAERLERYIREIVEDRELVGLYPNYPF